VNACGQTESLDKAAAVRRRQPIGGLSNADRHTAPPSITLMLAHPYHFFHTFRKSNYTKCRKATGLLLLLAVLAIPIILEIEAWNYIELEQCANTSEAVRGCQVLQPAGYQKMSPQVHKVHGKFTGQLADRFLSCSHIIQHFQELMPA